MGDWSGPLSGRPPRADRTRDSPQHLEVRRRGRTERRACDVSHARGCCFAIRRSSTRARPRTPQPGKHAAASAGRAAVFVSGFATGFASGFVSGFASPWRRRTAIRRTSGRSAAIDDADIYSPSGSSIRLTGSAGRGNRHRARCSSRHISVLLAPSDGRACIATGGLSYETHTQRAHGPATLP